MEQEGRDLLTKDIIKTLQKVRPQNDREFCSSSNSEKLSLENPYLQFAFLTLYMPQAPKEVWDCFITMLQFCRNNVTKDKMQHDIDNLAQPGSLHWVRYFSEFFKGIDSPRFTPVIEKLDEVFANIANDDNDTQLRIMTISG